MLFISGTVTPACTLTKEHIHAKMSPKCDSCFSYDSIKGKSWKQMIHLQGNIQAVIDHPLTSVNGPNST